MVLIGFKGTVSTEPSLPTSWISVPDNNKEYVVSVSVALIVISLPTVLNVMFVPGVSTISPVNPFTVVTPATKPDKSVCTKLPSESVSLKVVVPSRISRVVLVVLPSGNVYQAPFL